jgi:dTDP-4-dehydrorhamnose reductase
VSAGGRIAVIGATGQLGAAVAVAAAAAGHAVARLSRPAIDLERPQTIAPALEAVRPAIVVNAAAWTAVDLAESEERRAMAVNAEAPGELARWCAASGAWLIHVSTDYVFDGRAQRPYQPEDPPAPLNAYGRSKAAGEAAIRARLDRHVIVRSAWLYAAEGRNFLTTMVRLAGEREEVRIVADQRGSPTYAADLAAGLIAVAERLMEAADADPAGTFHLTNGGETTWHDFAAAIFAELAARGRPVPRLVPISTADWPAAASRPLYSALDCTSTAEAFGVRLPHWREALARCFAARDRA